MKSIVTKAAMIPDSEGVRLAKILDLETKELSKKV